jgi:hypothetical protein
VPSPAFASNVLRIFDLGDLNDDSRRDLGVTLADGTLQILLRNNPGTGFQAPVQVLTGLDSAPEPAPMGSAVGTADFNGDSKLDIAWTSISRDVRIWLGNGTGFGATTATPGSFPALAGNYASGWSIIR